MFREPIARQSPLGSVICKAKALELTVCKANQMCFFCGQVRHVQMFREPIARMAAQFASDKAWDKV